MSNLLVWLPYPFWNTNFFQYLRDYFCYCHFGLTCITMGIQSNSSHIVLYQKGIQKGAFLVSWIHVPIFKPTCSGFIPNPVPISCCCEEWRSSVVETRKHLRLISQKTALTELGGFFVLNKKARLSKITYKIFKLNLNMINKYPLLPFLIFAAFVAGTATVGLPVFASVGWFGSSKNSVRFIP